MKPSPDSTRGPILAQALALLQETVPGLIAVYRFGSYGTAHERDDSDLDLAILATQQTESVRRWELAQQLARQAGCDVDLVDLAAASAVLRAQVLAFGERLYCADRARCEEFEDFAYADYARLNEERREILADIRAQGSIYGG